MKIKTFYLIIFFASLPPGICRAADTGESPSPVTTCGWIKNAQTGNDVISALMQGLEELGGKGPSADGALSHARDGIAFYIKTVDAPSDGKSTTIWCITHEGGEAGENMVKELAGGFMGPSSRGKNGSPFPASDPTPSGRELAGTLTRLDTAGYGDFVRDNIDLVSLYARPFRCSQLGRDCYGEANCGFSKTARLAFHTLSPSDAAALWVHEAAHLEGCYNDEAYARDKELDFRARIREGAGRAPEARPSPW